MASYVPRVRADRHFRGGIEAELQLFLEAHPPPMQGVSWQVRKILNRAHEDLFDSTLNVKKLKSRCELSDHNVSCQFKHEVGISIKEYIETLRLEAACLLLAQSSFSVSEVANSVGYCHLQTFYKAFERQFHCTPGSVRSQGRVAGGDSGNQESALAEEQRRILVAAMERILPSEPGPGATDAHAIGYVEWITQEDCFQPLSPCFTSGLTLLESLATAMWGKSFPVCRAEERDAVLQKVQSTPHPTARRFFVMLVRMTLTGFLCDPRYGGNRGEIGWEYIGFSPRQQRSESTDTYAH
jgi:gluconate 2-dehydrogenase gamma chain